LKTFGVTCHHKGGISFLGGHVHGENGIEMHPWSKSSEFLAGFENIVSLEVTSLTDIDL
jgi:hypothetical protein